MPNTRRKKVIKQRLWLLDSFYGKWTNRMDSLGSKTRNVGLHRLATKIPTAEYLSAGQVLRNQEIGEFWGTLQTLKGNKFLYSYHSGKGYRNEPRSQVSMSPLHKILQGGRIRQWINCKAVCILRGKFQINGITLSNTTYESRFHFVFVCWIIES